MINFIALISRSSVIPPRPELDKSFFTSISILLIITIIGCYYEYKKNKKEEEDFVKYKEDFFKNF
ncbi:hypothetical protein JJC03_04435 [Flavobacterium oreochromis]|uniref:hypothetical protein n=1 Tax=Flavobacterium oreochromis TaxID=2906078 RepID=UPI001CE4E580|nr:hypothetical protein [Flavobacterium oreochromis]QYS87199.1 hypothetical protein JJC03_04435 [Flavobacterium oreochromis]